MWAVSPPTFTVEDSADACARGIQDPDLRRRLLESRAELAANSETLQAAISADGLHGLQPSNCPVQNLTDAEMSWFYDQRFAKLKRPGRRLYDQVMSAAPMGRCCYCQYGQAKSLDHFIPRDHMPTLSLDPWNLVPACEQCNHKLQSSWHSQQEQQMLHPYQMPLLGRWLRGVVVDSDPISIEFSVDPIPEHAADLQKRIKYEFKALGLAELYSVVASADIAIAMKTLQRSFPPDEAGALSVGNELFVRAHLREIANDAFRVDENSLRGVILEALAVDTAFCEGGYLNS